MKRSYKYKVVLWWGGNDKVWFAEHPELPGCMSHGRNRTSALKHLDNAADLWIETQKKYGREVPQPEEEKGTAGL